MDKSNNKQAQPSIFKSLKVTMNNVKTAGDLFRTPAQYSCNECNIENATP